MSASLEIETDTAELLAEQAKAQGLSVDEYLKTLLSVGGNAQRAPEPTVYEFMAAMESLADANVEPLPRDFSREDMYFPEG